MGFVRRRACVLLDRLEQIPRLGLVDVELAGARGTKDVRLDHGATGIERVHLVAHDLLDRHEGARIGNAHESRQRRRNTERREMEWPRLRVLDDDEERERAARDARRRISGRFGDRVRRERRLDRRTEVLAQREPGRRIDLVEPNARRCRAPRALQRFRAGALLAPHERLDALAQIRELLVRRPLGDAPLAGDGERAPLERAHPHHEQLVEIHRHDRHVSHPLEERRTGVLGHRQHPRIELEEALAAVEQPLGADEVLVRRRGSPRLRRRGFHCVGRESIGCRRHRRACRERARTRGHEQRRDRRRVGEVGRARRAS